MKVKIFSRSNWHQIEEEIKEDFLATYIVAAGQTRELEEHQSSPRPGAGRAPVKKTSSTRYDFLWRTEGAVQEEAPFVQHSQTFRKKTKLETSANAYKYERQKRSRQIALDIHKQRIKRQPIQKYFRDFLKAHQDPAHRKWWQGALHRKGTEKKPTYPEQTV